MFACVLVCVYLYWCVCVCVCVCVRVYKHLCVCVCVFLYFMIVWKGRNDEERISVRIFLLLRKSHLATHIKDTHWTAEHTGVSDKR